VEAVEKLDLPILPHLPYTPDSAPYNFRHFPKVKEDRHGHLYDSDEEVEKKTLRTLMKKQNVELFCDGFEKLVCRQWKFVENGGDYVEK
jgi:hypothetical protein